jgi:hypothetical protein
VCGDRETIHLGAAITAAIDADHLAVETADRRNAGLRAASVATSSIGPWRRAGNDRRRNYARRDGD